MSGEASFIWASLEVEEVRRKFGCVSQILKAAYLVLAVRIEEESV